MNKDEFVNEAALKGAVLEQALLEVLQGVLAEVHWLASRVTTPNADGGVDAVIEIETNSGSSAALDVQVKSQMRPSTFVAWSRPRAAAAHARGRLPVLGLPHVSSRMAEVCETSGWGWFDLAGNCCLDIPGVLHVARTGRPAAHRPPRAEASLASDAAGRVVRALLTPGGGHPGRSWTQRDLRAVTDWQLDGESPVSLGLVNKVMRHLRSEGYVADGDTGSRVVDPLGLLYAWRDAYEFEQHQRLSYFTLLRSRALTKALDDVGLRAGGWARYAAFSAAERQAPHVRQNRTWVYVLAKYLPVLQELAEAKRVDSGENLVVLVPRDSGVFLSFASTATVGEQVMDCTDPVQTWVDLMHCGGRGEEAATAVLEQSILPSWRAAGVV